MKKVAKCPGQRKWRRKAERNGRTERGIKKKEEEESDGSETGAVESAVWMEPKKRPGPRASLPAEGVGVCGGWLTR